MKKTAFIFLSLLIIVACSNNGKKPAAEKSVIVQPNKEKKVVNSMVGHPGKKVYESVCLACHMRNGTGVPGMHPPLTKSDFVNGDPDKLINIVLNGLSGEITVKDEIFNNVMPAQANLSDQEVADVLTYIRGSFGNSSGPITSEQVAKVRALK